MRTIIAGSRNIDLPLNEMESFFILANREVSEVVCGMAKGVDLSGKRWADHYGVKVAEFPADWDEYGRSAGPIRNKQMAEYAEALILIWDGKSRGSANMLKQAKMHGLEIFEHIVE